MRLRLEEQKKAEREIQEKASMRALLAKQVEAKHMREQKLKEHFDE